MPWTAPAEERFRNQYVVQDDGCWLFKNGNKNGYGDFWDGKKHGTAHRFSYELHVGPVPQGMVVMHSCDVKRCVNPQHLSAGTVSDNTQDMIRKKRGVFQKNGGGESHPNHKLTYDQVLEIKRLVKLGQTQRAIAQIFHVNQSAVSKIVSGKRWQQYVPMANR